MEQQFSPEVRTPFEKKVFYAQQSEQHPDEAISLVQSWLQQNISQQASLDQLAALVDLSPRQLNRRFQAVVGQTPNQYTQQIRCVLASDLLKNTNLNIADVAAAVGYNDSSYFTKIFNRYAGQSPSDYRKKVRAKLFVN